MTQLHPAPSVDDQDGQDDRSLALLRSRLARLETVIRRIEDELTDDEIDDDQKLQNIGERVAGAMDGR